MQAPARHSFAEQAICVAVKAIGSPVIFRADAKLGVADACVGGLYLGDIWLPLPGVCE